MQPPICRNCKRRGQPCDYQILFPDTTSQQTSQPQNNALVLNARLQASQERHATTVGILGLRPGATFSLFDLEDQIWEAEFARQVQHQPFLQHNFLAIASLHSHLTTTPSSGYLYVAACAHHLEASRLFRREISDVSERNWLATLVFAVGVGIFHFGISKSEPSTSIMETMFFLRHASLLVSDITPWFQASSLRSIIQGKLGSTVFALDVDTSLAFKGLADHNACHAADETTKKIYNAAISSLQDWLVLTCGHPRSWIHLIWWPSNLESDYMALLARRERMALVIFTYWCAVMRKAPRRWFLDGWAVRVATPIIETLGHDLDDVLEWPRRALGL